MTAPRTACGSGDKDQQRPTERQSRPGAVQLRGRLLNEEREKILHEEKEEGGGGWGGWGTAVTGWRTQPPATQRGNNNRTLHLIFRTSPLASTAGYLLAAAVLPAPSRHNTSQNTAR